MHSLLAQQHAQAARPTALRACLPRSPAPARPAVSWPGWPCRGPVSRHNPVAHCPCCHNTIFVLLYNLPAAKPLYCNTVCSCYNTMVYRNTKFSSPAFSCLQYNNCIAIKFSAYPMLQYNPAPLYITIQCSLLQYNLGSSPNQFLHQFFFSFFFIILLLLLFSIISSSWKNH